MYDINHNLSPEYCTLGITTDGYIAMSGGHYSEFEVGQTWRLPFDFTFTAI